MIRLLHEQRIAKLPVIAQIGECIGIAARALHFAGERECRVREIEVVERDVAERELLFENRRETDPLREPVAEHERVVAEP